MNHSALFLTKIAYVVLGWLNPITSLFDNSASAAVLMYHSVGNSRLLFNVTAADLAKQLEYLVEKKYKIISLSELIANLKKKELSGKTVILTFDDAYADNYFNAWPILKKIGAPATVFVPTAFIGKEMNNSANAPMKIMASEQIKEMADSGLIEFGSHTHTHPDLGGISDEEFEKEVLTSKNILEAITGRKCDFFSYPKGKFRESFFEILKSSGFKAALTVREGLVKPGDDFYCLKRNFIYSKGGFALFKGKTNRSVIVYNFLKKIFK